MDLTPYRSQLSIHVLRDRTQEMSKLVEALTQRGHQVQVSYSDEALVRRQGEDPSHIVIVDLQLLTMHFEDLLDQCLVKAPNTYFIAVGPKNYIEATKTFSSYGVMAYVENGEPMVSRMQWAIDSVLERIILKIQNRNLLKENVALKAQSEILLSSEKEFATGQQDFSNWLLKFEMAPDREELISLFFESVQTEWKNVKILYLRYLHQEGLLMVEQALGIDPTQALGMALKLTHDDFAPGVDSLSNPRGFPRLAELMQEKLGTQDIYVKPIKVRESIEGLFVFFGSELDQLNSIGFANKFSFFRLVWERLLFMNVTFEFEVREILDGIISYQDFQEILNQELKMAKKWGTPLSLLRVAVDKFSNDPKGHENLELLARGLKQTSHGNNQIYRIGKNEIAVILPFSDHATCTMRAECVRRFMEMAQKSNNFSPVELIATISLGISEFPHLALTAEELMKGSLQALTAVMGRGGNKVGVARPLKTVSVREGDHGFTTAASDPSRDTSIGTFT